MTRYENGILKRIFTRMFENGILKRMFMRIFENGMLKRIFSCTGGEVRRDWNELYIEELCNITKVTMSVVWGIKLCSQIDR
jgi:hypothetical protein